MVNFLLKPYFMMRKSIPILLFLLALPLILVMLIAAAAYTFWRRDFGAIHRPQHHGRREFAYALILGGAIGFYDGFFGPGTGSFFVFLFVHWLGYDFLHASASAKLLNTASNLAAIVLFTLKGHVWWHFVVAMAIAIVVLNIFVIPVFAKVFAGFNAGRVRFIIGKEREGLMMDDIGLQHLRYFGESYRARQKPTLSRSPKTGSRRAA